MSEQTVAAELAVPTPGRGLTVSIVGILSVAVAFTGYLREAALAARFGISPTMDAYFGAIFIPNLLYVVLIAGTLSTVLIPVLLSRDDEQSPAKISETFSVITNFVLLVLLLAVAIATATARYWLPRLFAGFTPVSNALAIQLTYIVLPAVMFLALAGILTAVLNGFHRFTVATFAPALSSICVIAAVWLSKGNIAIYVVTIATAVGFLLQCLVLLPAAASLGIQYRPILNLRHPAITQFLRLGIPLFLYLVVANASLFLERNLASRLSVGAVSLIRYALRLFTVPTGFLAGPLATVIYPEFVRYAARKQFEELRLQTLRAVRLAVFLFFPITIWTILNALPLTRLLYERGQFHLADSLITSKVLALYSIGILPNAVAIVLLRCFYAVNDTITPLFAETIDLAYYVVVATLLSRHFGLNGLAITRGGAFFVVAAVLITVALRRRTMLMFDLAFFKFLFRTAAASLMMAAVSWVGMHLLQGIFDTGATFVRALVVLAILALSGSVFLLAAYRLDMEESKRIIRTAADLLTKGNIMKVR